MLNGYSETDPAGQLRRFREELMFADLEIVTNRIGKLETNLKKPRPAKEREADQTLDHRRVLTTPCRRVGSPPPLRSGCPS